MMNNQNRLTLPPINQQQQQQQQQDQQINSLDDIQPVIDETIDLTTNVKPMAFKFGQVDQKLLLSRLYSTPFNKASSHQKYVLDMGTTSLNKPHIKLLEKAPPQAEPVVSCKKHF